MLQPAMAYHHEGLNVIPVKPRAKAPALKWDEYKVRRSSEAEVEQWFGNGNHYNIGLVHGQFGDRPYYVAIDIDHDEGAYEEIKARFFGLTSGRIEQSGSGEGYHIPLWVEEKPPWGNQGNKTWQTNYGAVNIRLSGCQTVAPPSIHPSGNLYQFIQDGDIGYVYTLEPFIKWLGSITPVVQRSIPDKPVKQHNVTIQGESLLDAVLSYWDNCLMVFAHFGLTDNVKEDRGELRLLGNGGLLITQDHSQFYNFTDEFGGGVIEAWGYCRLGAAYDKHKDFYIILCEMAGVAGIDIEKYKQRYIQALRGNTQRWTNQYRGAFGKLRG